MFKIQSFFSETMWLAGHGEKVAHNKRAGLSLLVTTLSATNSHLDDLCGGQIACYVHQVNCLALEKQNTKHQQKKPVISLPSAGEMSFLPTCTGGTDPEPVSADLEGGSCQGVFGQESDGPG